MKELTNIKFMYYNELIGGIELKQNESNTPSVSLEDNLKKALTELLILRLLSRREYYISELTSTLHESSQGTLTIVFPYAAVYRLLESEFIIETRKRIAPDGRRRQYYRITERGQIYLAKLLDVYATFTRGVAMVLAEGDD